jgi:hypothetical protein
MTQTQDDITTMFETTLQVLEQNSAAWNGRPAFADAVTRAREGTTAIRGTTGKQQTPTTGVAEDKEAARTDLEDKMVVLAGLLSAYAAKSGDHDLGARVEMTRSSVDRLSESDLVQTATRVADTATANLSALESYGVKSTQVTELTEARTKFESIKGSPREAIVGRKVATMSLPTTIAAVRSIFRNEIDKMMQSFRTGNRDFYNAYITARIVVNRGATRPPKSNGSSGPAPSPSAPAPSPAPSPAPPR